MTHWKATRSAAIVEIPTAEAPSHPPRPWVIPVVLVTSLVGLALVVIATTPRVAPVEWSRLRGPPEPVSLDTLTATDDRLAMLSGVTSDGVLLWSSPDGEVWESQILDEAPTRLSRTGQSLIGYDEAVGRRLEAGDHGWAETDSVVFPDIVRTRQLSTRPGVVAGEEALLVMTLAGDVWRSENWSDFTRVVSDPAWGPGTEVPFDSSCHPPSRTSPDVPPLVATDQGFLALVSMNPDEPFGIWPVCEPSAWVSPDGLTWESHDANLGDGAFVFDVAWRRGLFVAVGGTGTGEPALWVSENGWDWDLMETVGSLGDVDLFSAHQGPAGWVVLGEDSRSRPVGWISGEGLCWEPVPDFVGGSHAVVTSDHILITGRTEFPEIWVGAVSDLSGICR